MWGLDSLTSHTPIPAFGLGRSAHVLLPLAVAPTGVRGRHTGCCARRTSPTTGLRDTPHDPSWIIGKH